MLILAEPDNPTTFTLPFSGKLSACSLLRTLELNYETNCHRKLNSQKTLRNLKDRKNNIFLNEKFTRDKLMFRL